MDTNSQDSLRPLAAYLGISAVVLFCAALVIFSIINPQFDLANDYVSKLGAIGQPYALGWNLVGFLSVGLLLAVFGWAYGRIVDDRLVGILFTLFGLGFAATGVPTGMAGPTSPMSKAHVVAICLALAAWLFGLARLTGSRALEKSERAIANVTAILLVSPIIGFSIGLWSMPTTHRLVFFVVFAWVTVASLRLLRSGRTER